MEEKKEFYLMVKGEKVIVSEEVYREYVRPVRKEQRRQRRNWRCLVVAKKWKNGKTQIVRCKDDCSECRYAVNGKPMGNTLSLDEFKDRGYEIENKDLDIEADYIEEESDRELKEKLHKAIKTLTPRQQEMVRLVYFDNLPQEDVARHLGVSKQAISNAMARIYATLKKNMEKN